MSEISHYELCRLTAQRFLKNRDVAIWEYQTIVSDEHPDCLVFGGKTELYEIKVSRADFKKDIKKSSRQKYRANYYYGRVIENKLGIPNGIDVNLHKNDFKLVFKDNRALGGRRYYVCPKGLIKPEEINNGWGLYYFTGKQFRLIKESENFERNLFRENLFLMHMLRTLINGGRASKNIMVQPY